MEHLHDLLSVVRRWLQQTPERLLATLLLRTPDGAVVAPLLYHLLHLRDLDDVADHNAVPAREVEGHFEHPRDGGSGARTVRVLTFPLLLTRGPQRVIAVVVSVAGVAPPLTAAPPSRRFELRDVPPVWRCGRRR